MISFMEEYPEPDYIEEIIQQSREDFIASQFAQQMDFEHKDLQYKRLQVVMQNLRQQADRLGINIPKQVPPSKNHQDIDQGRFHEEPSDWDIANELCKLIEAVEVTKKDTELSKLLRIDEQIQRRDGHEVNRLFDMVTELQPDQAMKWLKLIDSATSTVRPGNYGWSYLQTLEQAKQRFITSNQNSPNLETTFEQYQELIIRSIYDKANLDELITNNRQRALIRQFVNDMFQFVKENIVTAGPPSSWSAEQQANLTNRYVTISMEALDIGIGLDHHKIAKLTNDIYNFITLKV